MNIFNVILSQPLANGLIFFYNILGHNLGVAILVFSIVLVFALRPLTRPYMESMKKIKELQPQLDKLKKKHGSDKLKFSQAQAEFYKQKGINPGKGCLPYIFQIVILIALFRVFTTVLSANGDTVEKLNELLYAPLKISQEQGLNTKFLYLDTAKPDTFRFPGLPIPIPGPVLILATLVQFLSVKASAPRISQEKKIAKKTKGGADDLQVTMQQSMTYTMPLLTLFFGMTFPSGLALYWLIFSVFNLWQQDPSFKNVASLLKLSKLNAKDKNS
ncbi:YidC/Oxa1 family membrane protein insertase [Patescibacteria group bacterium]